jgi:hypothetical protein
MVVPAAKWLSMNDFHIVPRELFDDDVARQPTHGQIVSPNSMDWKHGRNNGWSSVAPEGTRLSKAP